jgi:uncharacterized protein YecT (DUF1311 family)
LEADGGAAQLARAETAAEPATETPPGQGVKIVTVPPPKLRPGRLPPATAPVLQARSETPVPRRVEMASASPPRTLPTVERRTLSAPPPPAAREPVRTFATAEARSPDPATGVRPASHCDSRLRPSEQMVCADPELAALDRQLNHAFNLAVRSGASREALREEQDDWEMARERAARRSPAAVADLYRKRIDDLMSLAEQRGEFDPG